MSGELLWYVSRAAGAAAIALLTGVFVLGVVTSGRRRVGGNAVIVAVHRWLALGLVAFLAAHVVTAVLDGYVDLGWLAVLVPGAAGYERWLVALGTLALDLLLAVVATSLLRERLGRSAWRAVHWLSYAMWPVALLHGFVMGTSDEPLLRGVTVVCAVVGTAAVGWRLTTSYADRDTRRRVAAQGWS